MKTNYLPFFVYVLLVGLVGCGGGSGDPPRWDIAHTTKKETATAQSVVATDNLVVYLDTSASMAGYVSPNGKNLFSVSADGSTIFSKTLLALRDVVTSMSPEPHVVFRHVDTNVSPPSFDNLELSKAATNRSIFNGKETNLAGAIKMFADPLDKNSEDQAPPRFHILITDGVQSSDKNNTSVSCAKGSDSFCVKSQLHDLMNKGWGGAVLGLRSEFNGNLYSEITPKAIPVNSGKDPNKFRPFYLYVFSPDRIALDKLVESLRQKLVPLTGTDVFREYALTTDYSRGVATVETLQEKQTKDLLDVRLEKGKEGEMPRVQVKSALDTETKGKQQFVLSVKPSWTEHAKAGGSPDELAKMIKWELRPIFPEKEDPNLRYPVFVRSDKSDVKGGNIELTFETGWSKAPGKTAWRMFQLIGTLDVERAAPPWVSAWTTNLDTTVESANKTLNLESSLANLWKNTVLENYPIVEICVRVGQK